MEKTDLLKIENQLCFPLYAAARKVVGAYAPVLKPLDLTYTQYITMMVLWEQNNETVGTLCRKLHLDSGTMTPLLKKLESRGYLVRVRDTADERIVHVTLTEKGMDLKNEASYVPERIAGCMNLSDDEARTLYAILYKIINTI